MSEALERFEDGIEHIDALAVEVRQLHASNEVLAASNEELRKSRHRQRILLIVLVVIAVALALITFLTLRGFDNQRENACQSRNHAARVTREFAEQQFAIFEQATQQRDATQEQLRLLELLRRAVPQREQTEIDCNGDGDVNADDYPDRRDT